MKPLSKITEGLIGQPMFKLLVKMQEEERAGEKIYHFEIGDSDFPAHTYIVEAVKKALDEDRTHYVDSTGIPEFKEAISHEIKNRLGFQPSSKQILVMPSNAIIDFVVRCVADPGDEIIYPDPGFSTYIAVTNYTGVKKVGVSLKESNGFHIEPEQIEKRITNKTKLIILNSPSNPTGAALNKEEILKIALIAKKHNLYLLSDEIYSKVIYDERLHYSPSELDHCQERTIILDGFAKGYSMPGFRLGYAIGPELVIEKMGLLFQTIFSCFPPFIQYGGISALTENQNLIEQRIKMYQELRDLIYEKLNSMPGISCLKPEGAVYIFPNITKTGMTSQQFAEFALEKANIALLPGTCFGEYGEGYVRLCFTRKTETIIEAMDKLKKALELRKQ
jgi:aspartate/methionine/tyrosine aminotransferase